MATILNKKLWLRSTSVGMALTALAYGLLFWNAMNAYQLAGNDAADLSRLDHLLLISHIVFPIFVASLIATLISSFLLILSILKKQP